MELVAIFYRFRFLQCVHWCCLFVQASTALNPCHSLPNC